MDNDTRRWWCQYLPHELFIKLFGGLLIRSWVGPLVPTGLMLVIPDLRWSSTIVFWCYRCDATPSPDAVTTYSEWGWTCHHVFTSPQRGAQQQHPPTHTGRAQFRVPPRFRHFTTAGKKEISGVYFNLLSWKPLIRDEQWIRCHESNWCVILLHFSRHYWPLRAHHLPPPDIHAQLTKTK